MHIYTASKKERKKERKKEKLMICIYTLHKKKKKRKKKKKERKRHVLSAKTQSLISFRCPHEENLGPYLPTERTSKTMT